MTTAAQTIIAEAQRALNDKSGIRMPASDLVQCLNRAQRDIALARPDTTAALFELTLVEGAKQTLPSNVALLIDIPANATGKKSSITRTGMELLDACDPSWRSMSSASAIQHYCNDIRNPRLFYVYPPAASGVKVDFEASLYPADVPAPASPGIEASTVSGNISLADEWSTALLMVTLYYAYLTDVESLANVGLAAGYKQTAEQILGVQIKSAVAAQEQE